MTDSTTPCDDSYALSDFVRGLNGFTGAPLADVVDPEPTECRGCGEIETASERGLCSGCDMKYTMAEIDDAK